MTPTFTTTTKWALRKLAGTNVVSDIDAGFDALGEDLDSKLTPYTQGLFADRPVSTSGTPGKAGRFYRSTDTGAIDLDTGTRWCTVTLGIGEIREWAGSTAPENWRLLQGQAISRSTYAVLFAMIGTTYGAGNGTTTFNLPDAQGRVSVMAGTGSGLTARTLADTGGEETHVLTVSEMPAHIHTLSKTVGLGIEGSPTAVEDRGFQDFFDERDDLILPTGGDAPHNNMQPFIVLNKIIRVL